MKAFRCDVCKKYVDHESPNYVRFQDKDRDQDFEESEVCDDCYSTIRQHVVTKPLIVNGNLVMRDTSGDYAIKHEVREGVAKIVEGMIGSEQVATLLAEGGVAAVLKRAAEKVRNA